MKRKIVLFAVVVMSVIAQFGGAGYAAEQTANSQPDSSVNSPVYTNTWKNAYLPTKCGDKWKASPLYHKSMALGYKSFKQDNNWNNGRLATQIVDFQRFNSGDLSPTTVRNGYKTKWFSNRSCYTFQSEACNIPGLCDGGGASWATIVVLIYEWLDRDSSGGKYCAGTPRADNVYDCCMRAPNEDKPRSPTYYFEQGGQVSIDDQRTWFPMYYVYQVVNNRRLYMRNECAGDDIYWGDKDPSLIYFTNHNVARGSVRISYWTQNAQGVQEVEVARDEYVTPDEPVNPSALPKASEVQLNP